MLKAVIFDMDGLMIDSEIVTYRCYKEVMAKMDLNISIEFYKTLLGKTIAFAKGRFDEEYGKDFPFEQVVHDVHVRIKEIFDEEGVPVKPGLVELLTFLKDNGYKTVVATSSNRERVEDILGSADVLKYFDDSVCGPEVKNSKPAPDIFLTACEKVGVLPSEALVLEDSEAGIEAAYRAKIDVINIPDMKYPEEQYEKMTTRILDTLFDVIEYIKD